MITIRDIARAPWRPELGSKPEMDPLTEPDALLEAQVLDINFDAVRGAVSILFEMRLALQLREGNTGLLIAHEVSDFRWTAEPRGGLRTAWNVVGSEPSLSRGKLELRVGMLPKAELFLRARVAAFYSGDVPGLVEIPDYGLVNDARLAEMIAGWDSEFHPLHAAFLDEDRRGLRS